MKTFFVLFLTAIVTLLTCFCSCKTTEPLNTNKPQSAEWVYLDKKYLVKKDNLSFILEVYTQTSPSNGWDLQKKRRFQARNAECLLEALSYAPKAPKDNQKKAAELLDELATDPFE